MFANALNTTIVLISGFFLSISLAAEPADAYDYFAVVHAYEAPGNPFQLSHVYATVVRIPKKAGAISPADIEYHTVSWLPASMWNDPKPLRLRQREAGKNFTLAQTRIVIDNLNARLAGGNRLVRENIVGDSTGQKGAFRISPSLYYQIAQKENYLNGPNRPAYGVYYPRESRLRGSVYNCYNVLGVYGAQHGVLASQKVLDRWSPALLTGKAEPWVLDLLNARVTAEMNAIRGIQTRPKTQPPAVAPIIPSHATVAP